MIGYECTVREFAFFVGGIGFYYCTVLTTTKWNPNPKRNVEMFLNKVMSDSDIQTIGGALRYSIIISNVKTNKTYSLQGTQERRAIICVKTVCRKPYARISYEN